MKLITVDGCSAVIMPQVPPKGCAIEVRVELKDGILDAEGTSIEKSLRELGIRELSGVRTARIYTLSFSGIPAAEARRRAERAVDQLLANPVVHRVAVVVRSA
ncbi:MAG: phosphoribosylformylglycinamidine synthase subunit PurS [Thermoplasmata archaeon]